MKTDLISRQDAVDALYKMLHDCFGADDEELDAVITTLNELPSAQRKGKWLEKKVIPVYENGFPLQSCKCSECDRYDTRPYMYYFSEPNFCSYCGVEMMKGESDGKI